ncbi:MAG: hypothetical protein GEU93_06745 [Propionibacteriales bacterium]|nr:hypothetical protein [Propionibacteriales bacterium]
MRTYSFPRRHRRWFLGVLCAASLALTACGTGDGGGDDEAAEADGEQSQVDESAFYYDKELEIIVPFEAGGGTDSEARFMAPFLQEHIPGSPTVGVVNISGAAGTIGNNQFALEREHTEATSVLYSSASSFLPWIFEEPALELNYDDLVGNFVSQVGGIVYVRCDTGIDGPEAFVEQAQDMQWVAGEQTPDSLGAHLLLAYDMLGLEHNAVMGFEGRGPARVAFEQGELNINWDTSPSVPSDVDPLIEDGVACPVFTIGQASEDTLEADAMFSEEPYNLPTFAEIYEQIHGEPPSGPEWDAYLALTRAGWTNQKVMWLHKDAPPEAVEQLRAGFEAMTEDPEFQSQAEELLGPHPKLVGDDVDPAVDGLRDFPEDIRNWIMDFLVENYDHPDPR